MCSTWILGLFLAISVIVGNVCCRQNINGIYTDVQTSDLIIPRKVDRHGHHITHNLTHHHDNDGDDLHYHIVLNNTLHHIELQPSTTFIAPLMIVERHRRDLRTRKRPSRNTNCHYHGHVRGHEHSNVALSACDGLAGHVKTSTAEYYIEPSHNHKAQEDGHPHIVFQKSGVKTGKNQHNGVHHKRKRRKRKNKKKHMVNTCGTKEPRRLTDTRIEWQTLGEVRVQGGRKTRGQAHHHNGGGFGSNKRLRPKRSVSSPRHVEALIVADESMVAFHQDGNVETYLLTIMNMVSSLYKDPAIGNLIHVVVVKIILLEEDESHPDFNVTHIAENNLANFCRWQRTLNPKNEMDPHHHDVAVLITRKDICSSNGCTTLGVANVGGMCRPDKSCSVNEDNGITLAHTITHELGHNFGMYHDTEKIGCEGKTGHVVHVMTPSFQADTLHVSWSNCSRRDITHFLDQGLGKCLDDAPSKVEFSYPELPAGAMYNADLQCRLQFNITDDVVSVCSKLDEICSKLWCLVDDVCVTHLRPAAPGTHCGKHKWCQDQKCVHIEDLPKPVDGGWGNWSKWSTCSRSCGAGVSIQTRQCDHPSPANGGSFCVGERMRYKICNTEICSEGYQSFRALQCAGHNNETYKGEKMMEWTPYFDSHFPCELYCTDADETVISDFGDAADGTSCNIGTNDMCISGICKKVGCDWIVDSNTTEDQCGVCGGTGETCNTIKGEFNQKFNISDGYFEITTIPAGSRHIIVEEMAPSKHFISVGEPNSNRTYLNGNRLIHMPGEYVIADAIGLYERDNNDQEKLKIPGPIKHDAVVYILIRGRHKNPGIRFEYTLTANNTLLPVFFWKLGDWTACSSTCGGGSQERMPICYQENKGVVDEANCLSNKENIRPSGKARTCNEVSCPAHWWIGPWQLCPVTCKNKGQRDPVKRRSIMCVDQNEMALPDVRCDLDSKPADSEICNTDMPYCKSDVDDLKNDNHKDHIKDDHNNEDNLI